jgi:membrane protein implicated in regulation of membrane protease activity
VVDLAASSLWSAVYMAIGLLGYALFDKPWQGVVAAIVLVLLTTVVSSLIQRWRKKSSAAKVSAEPVSDTE